MILKSLLPLHHCLSNVIAPNNRSDWNLPHHHTNSCHRPRAITPFPRKLPHHSDVHVTVHAMRNHSSSPSAYKFPAILRLFSNSYLHSAFLSIFVSSHSYLHSAFCVLFRHHHHRSVTVRATITAMRTSLYIHTYIQIHSQRCPRRVNCKRSARPINSRRGTVFLSSSFFYIS